MDDIVEYHSATNSVEIHNLFLLCSSDDEHHWIWWNHSNYNKWASFDDFFNFFRIWIVWIHSQCNRDNPFEFKESKWKLLEEISTIGGISRSARCRHRITKQSEKIHRIRIRTGEHAQTRWPGEFESFKLHFEGGNLKGY